MTFLDTIQQKIISREQWSQLKISPKATIVFTNGCFDVLHLGHVTYLAEARTMGDLLVVGLNSDASVRRLKGPSRPINDEKARSLVLASLQCVDYVIIFDEDTPLDLIKAVKPNVLVKGGDYTIDSIVGASFVQQRGGIVRTIPLVEGYSTTDTVQKLNDQPTEQ
ncbi:MAG: D-glycero-beta-D-manno-heptose 1-phosphate adenylyltransferase [Bacteroidales bacterium]|nr:D-glycero-beta-D-manno-heptose 1-phosphate adenylyltransferase [Bacteroidales bacterium]